MGGILRSLHAGLFWQCLALCYRQKLAQPVRSGQKPSILDDHLHRLSLRHLRPPLPGVFSGSLSLRHQCGHGGHRSVLGASFPPLSRQAAIFLQRTLELSLGPAQNRMIGLLRSYFAFKLPHLVTQCLSYQISSLHPTITLSWIASSGSPRRMSALRSIKINSIASRRLFLVSSIVSSPDHLRRALPDR